MTEVDIIWFLYDIGLRHERVKTSVEEEHSMKEISKNQVFIRKFTYENKK